MPEDNQLISQRKEKLLALKKSGVNPYPPAFNKKDYSLDLLQKYKNLKKEEKTSKKAVIAGRIMTLRIMGKAGFAHIQDAKGQIQIYARENDLGKNTYNIFSKLDLGDIVGITGTVFRTKKGEISIWVKDLKLLAKSLRPLPEKWHGLKDTEIRYRQRYVDLIVNPKVKETFLKRSQIISSTREFLLKEGFIEVETPILQPIYGGTNARPFKSFLHNLKMDVYMRISNELYLKRLIVGGYEKIFEFSPDFRNEGIDSTHNPEFLQMETMWAYANHQDNIKLCEKLIKYIVKRTFNKYKLTYGKTTIDFGKSFSKLSILDALKKHAKINADKLSTQELVNLLKQHNIEHTPDLSWGNAIASLFEGLVEDKLIQPTIIYDYPKETSPLAKIKAQDNRFVERFELYINGWEIANSYSELNDPELLRQNWETQEKLAKKGDEEAQRMDHDFIRALEIGMPPTSGLGIGVDRLVMLLTNSQSIKDVIFFPFMKPE